MLLKNVVLSSLILLGACASPGPAHKPAPMKALNAVGLSDQVQTTPMPQWWTRLGDPVLTQLVETAAQEQPNLKLVQARVERMLALADASKTSLTPQMSATAEFSRQRFTEHGLYPPPLAGNTYNSGTLQTGISWNPDWLGQHTAEIALALNQVQASQADARAALNLLATQITRGYIALAKLAEQQVLIQDALNQRQQVLTLTTQRVQAGLDTQLELLMAQAGLQEAQSQVEVVNEQISLVRHQLAALSGQPPQACDQLLPRLSQLHFTDVPQALGADLLGRRSDVWAARMRVEAATQDIKIAQTQFYPNVNIGAFVGLNAIGLDQLLNSGSLQVGVAPAIHLPIFQADRLRAQLKGKEAELDVAIATYNSTVLEAVREASDALSSSQSIARQQNDQAKALALSKSVYELNLERFKAGVANQVTVLNSQGQWFAQRRSAVELLARQFDSHVLLMKSLGGYWQETP